MFETILIPLNGSEMAEVAIPYVRSLAGQLEAEVYLLHVCPVEHQSYVHMYQIYLNSVADGLRKEIKEIWHPGQEPKVQAEVIVGEPVKVVLDYIKRKSISMMALTTHGPNGLRSDVPGNIADNVVREVDIANLIIRIKDEKHLPERKALIQRILLSLDSSKDSKAAIPYAVQLAKKLKASITLFSMVHTARIQYNAGMGGNASLGINWAAVDDATEKYVDEYLRSIEDEIRNAGVFDVSHICYLSDDTAHEILETKKKIQADLVVMATRGRSPIARWIFGDVTQRVLNEGDGLILLVKETTR